MAKRTKHDVCFCDILKIFVFDFFRDISSFPKSKIKNKGTITIVLTISKCYSFQRQNKCFVAPDYERIEKTHEKRIDLLH